MSKALGEATTFWSFGLILIFVFAYTFLFVPETKGKSLEQIQDMFRSNESTAQDDQERLVTENDVDPEVPE